MKTFSILTSLALCAALTGCSSDEPIQSEESPEIPDEEVVEEKPEENVEALKDFIPIRLTSAETVAVSDFNKFAWRLFAECNANANELFPEHNGVVSPLSVELCLSLLANAADGDTRNCILTALGVSDIAALNSLNAKLVAELSTIDNYTNVCFANSVWHRNFVNVKPEFNADLGKYYDAETELIYPLTVQDDVNRWCKDKTFGVIENFPLENTDLLYALLLNATYFKGVWSLGDKFDKKNTLKGDFYGESGVTKVDFMNQHLGKRYFMSECASAVTLYFGNNAYKLTLILPNEGRSIGDCLDELASNPQALQYNRLYDVTLSVPKFKTEGISVLNSALTGMGLGKLFNDKCSYFNMTDTELQFSLIQQASSFAIDEDGVVAAAITGGGSCIDPGPDENEPKKIDMRFERPFLYTISESSTNTTLFIGKVESL